MWIRHCIRAKVPSENGIVVLLDFEGSSSPDAQRAQSRLIDRTFGTGTECVSGCAQEMRSSRIEVRVMASKDPVAEFMKKSSFTRLTKFGPHHLVNLSGGRRGGYHLSPRGKARAVDSAARLGAADGRVLG
jgi:hypothetical protein